MNAIARYLEIEELTQREFAKRIGCTVAFVNGLVNGKNTDIKISLLYKIHAATKIPLERIVQDLLACKAERQKTNGVVRKRRAAAVEGREPEAVC